MENRKPNRGSGLLLYLLPLPIVAELLGSLMKGQVTRFALCGLALAGYFSAATLMRSGLRAERAFFNVRRARVGPRPRKLTAALLAGAATGFTAAVLSSFNYWESAAYAVGTVAGALLLYGFDPRPQRSPALPAGAEGDQIHSALADAEASILAIESANAQIANRELSARLNRIVARGRDILDVLDDHPAKLQRARRFLKTYLTGARRVAEGYARTHRRADSAELEDNFRNVLITIEDTFGQQYDRLLENDVLNLDVEIEVLKTQMEREGIR